MKITASINGRYYEEKISLKDILEWHPAANISVTEFKNLPKPAKEKVLEECSESYWVDVLNIEFGVKD